MAHMVAGFTQRRPGLVEIAMQLLRAVRMVGGWAGAGRLGGQDGGRMGVGWPRQQVPVHCSGFSLALLEGVGAEGFYN